MKIAIFSDTHDHIWNMRKAIEQVTAQEIELIVHCGDLVSPFMIDEFDPYPGRLVLIDGNNPGDQYFLSKKLAERQDKIEYQGLVARLEIGSAKIAAVHDPALALDLARSGIYSAVFFGHTHLRKSERMDQCLLHNPGALLGNKEAPSWSIFDTESGDIEEVIL